MSAAAFGLPVLVTSLAGVAAGAAADTTQVSELPVTGDAWISFIVRDGRLVPIRSDIMLRAGDEAVVLSTDPDAAGLTTLFTEPSPDQRGPPADRDYSS